MTDLYPKEHKDLYRVLKAFIQRHQLVMKDGLGPTKRVDLLEPQKYETMTIRLGDDDHIRIEGTLGAGFTICKDGEVWVWNERQH